MQLRSFRPCGTLYPFLDVSAEGYVQSKRRAKKVLRVGIHCPTALDVLPVLNILFIVAEAACYILTLQVQLRDVDAIKVWLIEEWPHRL